MIWSIWLSCEFLFSHIYASSWLDGWGMWRGQRRCWHRRAAVATSRAACPSWGLETFQRQLRAERAKEPWRRQRAAFRSETAWRITSFLIYIMYVYTSRRILYRPAFCVKVDVSPQRHVHFCVESDVAKSDQQILVRQPSHVFGVQKRTFRRKPFSFHRLASFLAVAVNSFTRPHCS